MSQTLRTLTSLMLLPGAAFLLSGCAGRLYTDLNPDLNAKSVEGVIVYEPTNVIELYEATTLVDKSTGKLLGRAPDGCKASNVQKMATRVNFAKPMVIRYDPGFLDQNKFSIAFKDNGQLASVNSESAPGAALSELATVLPFVLKDRTAAAAAPADAPVWDGVGKEPCNAGERLIGVFQYPEIQRYSVPVTQ